VNAERKARQEEGGGKSKNKRSIEKRINGLPKKRRTKCGHSVSQALRTRWRVVRFTPLGVAEGIQKTPPTLKKRRNIVASGLHGRRSKRTKGGTTCAPPLIEGRGSLLGMTPNAGNPHPKDTHASNQKNGKEIPGL